ncbi:Piwi-domain-containing protein [Obba rivulosa]|uniref:Piwi-domain-containing protein n=1 Tax=Obba rivulosa TaxID=1052685 RepID=A0A8E2J2M6_9APHY|nr:Piwi-domain-containing protein [Obba rivulosa]
MAQAVQAVIQHRSADQGPGTRGVRVNVFSNMFKLVRDYEMDFYQYHVAFVKAGTEVDTIGRRRAHALLYKLQLDRAEVFVSKGAYDGRKTIYFTQNIPSGTYDISDENDAAPRAGTSKLQVKLTQVAKFSSRDLITWAEAGRQDVINMLQIYLRQLPNIKYITPAHQRNYRVFYIAKSSVPLGGGLEAWRGVFQSVRPTLQGLAINVDVTTGVMIQGGPLPTVLMERFSLSNARQLDLRESDPLWKQIRQFLRGVIVKWGGKAKHERQMTINGLVPNVGDFEFERRGATAPEPITIKDYYYMTHGIALRHPHWPGVRSMSGTIVPMELCEVIPGQLYRGRIPEGGQATQVMLNMSKAKPPQRLGVITGATLGDTLNYSGTDLIHSGMRIHPDPTRVEARRLQAPRIMFQSEARVQAGRWNVARPQLQVFQPAAAPLWAVAIFVSDRYESSINQFAQNLVQCLTGLGVSVGSTWTTVRGTGQNARQTLDQLKQLSVKPSFVLAILPESAAEIKTIVKQWGDMMVGISTQCCRIDKVAQKARDNQYCNNVALKINAKLGGINSTAMTFVTTKWFGAKPTMVVGADIGHPSPGVRDRPSVSAVVGSMDRYLTTYTYSAKAQAPNQEFIDQLDVMMEQLIRDFHSNPANNCWPQRIIFFRDGLSEGQFERVARDELGLIQAAFQRIKELNGRPRVTYVVVTKRHHVRFFPQPNDMSNVARSGNCLPGLVVDTQITSPVYYDYFLQSQDGLQGTARPSHYTILCDENKMSVDDLQELSFALCHVYASATSSVSIPAPVYYADKVCTHVGAYHFNPRILGNAPSQDGATTSGDGDSRVNVQLWNEALGPNRTELRSKLFFL